MPTDGHYSRSGERVEVGDRPVGHVTLVVERAAGVSGDEADKLTKLLADHAARWIEGTVRAREKAIDRGTTLHVPDSERSDRGE